jgi:23S rRNA pseudouridine2605 synthase
MKKYKTPPIKNEKLQKILANAGLGSRRQMETLIQEGLVKVNGKIAKLGDRAKLNDRIVFKGKKLNLKPSAASSSTQILLYNKPAGEICTRSDPQGRPTVFQNLPKISKGRWIMIGRLDINTSGLLLFTNQGELAHQFMHPSFQVEREYAVRVFGEVTSEVLERLKKGINLEDGPAHFESIKEAGGTGKNNWYRVILKEGRCRLVRRLWESQGLTVSRLIRVRYGNFNLPAYLKLGKSKIMEDKVWEKY